MQNPMNTFENLQATNTVTFKGKTYRRKPRTYSVSIVRSAVAGASVQGTILLDPGLPFILAKLHADDTADPNGAGALQGLENWSVTIQDNESQYAWSSAPLGRVQQFGGREWGWPLPFEVLLRAQTQMTINITNRAAAPTAGTATIAFIGFSLLPMSME